MNIHDISGKALQTNISADFFNLYNPSMRVSTNAKTSQLAFRLDADQGRISCAQAWEADALHHGNSDPIKCQIRCIIK